MPVVLLLRGGLFTSAAATEPSYTDRPADTKYHLSLLLSFPTMAPIEDRLHDIN